MDITIYHNPRCSKSRQTLALIREAGHQPTIIEYLKQPPSADELRGLLAKLGKAPREAMRSGEAAFKERGLADPAMSDEALISAMAAEPILIERPIVVTDKGARLGRPPEAVQEIL